MPGTPDIEERVQAALAREQLTVTERWSNGPHAVYAEHEHPYGTVLYVLEGTIVFTLPATGITRQLGPGDRLDVPPGTRHRAVAGPAGVVCVEAHQEP